MAGQQGGAEQVGGSSARSQLRRLPELARYERNEIFAILDATAICHLAVVVDGEPLVLPTLYARDGDQLYLHGSRSSRLLRALEGGAPACAAVTVVDGIIVARSAFNSSVAYRSVVLFGRAEEVRDEVERLRALDLLTNALLPGRVDELRRPSARELALTKVLRLEVEEASAKVSSGQPDDEPEDLEGPAWGGLVPLERRWGEPEGAADGAVGRGERALPPSVQDLLEGPAW